MCNTHCLHATPFYSPLKGGQVRRWSEVFVRICRDASPEASDAGRTQWRNVGNNANAIEIDKVRTPEDGRPYDKYDDAAVRFRACTGDS